MNFLNFLTQSTSALNFNLSSLTNGIGAGNSSIGMSTPKMINTEQIIKEPSTTGDKKEADPIQKSQTKEAGHKDSQVQMFTMQQQLINQYMHLNIQLLSKKLQNLEHTERNPRPEESSQGEVKSLKKKIKKVNSCGHNDRDHYAKGMCNNCYHKYGRTKKPWNCPHDKLYANGMCQNCYINTYNKKRRQEKNDDKMEDNEVNSELKIEQE